MAPGNDDNGKPAGTGQNPAPTPTPAGPHPGSSGGNSTHPLSLVLPHILSSQAAIQNAGLRFRAEMTHAELMLAGQADPVALAQSVPPDLIAGLCARINAAQAPGSGPLRISSLSLYLIRALSELDPGHGSTLAVAYEPEFLFVADVGLPALAGVATWWKHGFGLGDPTFPDLSASKLRSVGGSDVNQLLYPAVAGELLVGPDASASAEAVARSLEAEGLWDVRVTGVLIEARCQPFREAEICHSLRAMPIIRYAEQNRVVRQGGLAPGWSAVRLV